MRALSRTRRRAEAAAPCFEGPEKKSESERERKRANAGIKRMSARDAGLQTHVNITCFSHARHNTTHTRWAKRGMRRRPVKVLFIGCVLREEVDLGADTTGGDEEVDV